MCKIEALTSLNYWSTYTINMTSVLSSYSVKDTIELLKTVKVPTDELVKRMEAMRADMEIPQAMFKNGARNFGQTASPTSGWRGGRFASAAPPSSSSSSSAPPPSANRASASSPGTSSASRGRYQSKFTDGNTDLDGKILHTIIGNKLNSFTPLTYNDTRDFMYQIIDSGETEFIKDFIKKVFAKATLEELYCGLFAKLIAEIAHKYPVMYEEMARYHQEFLQIFEDVESASENGHKGQAGDSDYADALKKKQYRMGYGQFLSELAGQNALEKSQLFAMVTTVMTKIWDSSNQAEKTKTVEEFIDCIVRLTKSLRDRSPVFFRTVKEELSRITLEKVTSLITPPTAVKYQSLSNKGRFGLMDFRDLIV